MNKDVRMVRLQQWMDLLQRTWVCWNLYPKSSRMPHISVVLYTSTEISSR